MKYYLIHQENELQVIPVMPEREIDFLLEYSQQILVSGETIREVLRAFDEMPLIFCNGGYPLLFCRAVCLTPDYIPDSLASKTP